MMDRDHPFSTCAKFSEKLTFFTPISNRRSRNISFQKILRVYLLTDPYITTLKKPLSSHQRCSIKKVEA